MLHSSLYWKTNKKQVGGEDCFVVWFPLPLIILYFLVFLFLMGNAGIFVCSRCPLEVKLKTAAV